MSVEELLIKLATGTGSTGIALFLAYMVYKLMMARQAKEFERQANETTPPPPPTSGQPPPGQRLGSNQNLQPVDDAIVTQTKCDATQAIIKERIDSVKLSQIDTNKRIDQFGVKLDRATERITQKMDKMTDSMVKLNTSVAILNDRSEKERK